MTGIRLCHTTAAAVVPVGARQWFHAIGRLELSNLVRAEGGAVDYDLLRMMAGGRRVPLREELQHLVGPVNRSPVRIDLKKRKEENGPIGPCPKPEDIELILCIPREHAIGHLAAEHEHRALANQLSCEDSLADRPDRQCEFTHVSPGPVKTPLSCPCDPDESRIKSTVSHPCRVSMITPFYFMAKYRASG